MNDVSDRHGLPLLAAGQAQKELTHNDAVLAIDGLLHPAAEAIGLTAPPPAPVAGQMWIVGAGAGDAWAGQDTALALYTTGGWRFSAATTGMLVWVKPLGRMACFDGSQWVDDAWPVARLTIGGQAVVGPRLPAIVGPGGGSVVDADARIVIEAILSTLRTHGLIDAV